MGTDELGRSVWTLFIWGSRISLFVGLAATIIAIALGAGFGIVAGYAGGRTEAVLMRITEFFLVIPFIPLAVVLASVLHRSLTNIIFVIGITSWPGTARLIRAQVLSVKTRLYVDRSRALGGRALAHHQPAHPAERDAADLRQPHADGADRDPVGEHAVVPRARRPAAHLVGRRARERVRQRGRDPRRVVVLPRARPRHHRSSRSRSRMCGRALEEILDPRLVEPT